MAQHSERPLTDEELEEFRQILQEGNDEIREYLADELDKDPEEYPSAKRMPR